MTFTWKSLWCGDETDGLSQVEIRVKAAFLLVFQNICQASRLWHSGKKRRPKQHLATLVIPKTLLKQKSVRFSTVESVYRFHSPRCVAWKCLCVAAWPQGDPWARLSGLALPSEVRHC